MMTKASIMRMIPKEKKVSVYDAWEDSDGIWIMLKEGWNADNMDGVCRTIHEGGDDEADTPKSEILKQLKYQISGIRKL